MNYEAAHALARHLCGLYKLVWVVESCKGWYVRALHPAGFWVVYNEPS